VSPMNLEFKDLVDGVDRIGMSNVLILVVVFITCYFSYDTLKKTKSEEIKQGERLLKSAEENAKSTSDSIREVKDMVFTISITLAELNASTRESIEFMKTFMHRE